jgi:O-antigen ligase
MSSESEPRTFSLARNLLGVLLLAAPLPYGAVYPWAWAPLAVLTLLVLILWMAASVGGGKLRIAYSPLYIPLALMLALGWTQLCFHLTLTPIATRECLLKLATDCVLFFVVVQLFSACQVETWRRAGIAVLIFGFIFSFLSILQFLRNPTRIIWVTQDIGTPFGSYVDRDHYAGLMELIIPLSASYVLSRTKRDPLNIVLWFAVLVSVVSLLLTGSRGGFASILVELVILGWVLIWRNPFPGRRMRVAALGLVLVALSALFFWLVPTFVLTKIGTISSYMSERTNRPVLWRNSLGIFRDHPLLGVGMGSFVTAYPRYETGAQDLIVEHAHNDYVEALAETGLIGGLLVLGALVLFMRTAFRNLAAQLRHETGWIQMGAAVSCCGLLVHSLVDFNLRIPANAAWFAFCAGLASLSGVRSRRKPAPGKSFSTITGFDRTRSEIPEHLT